METSAGIYGLESQGRTLCSHTSDVETIRFFVGTLSTRSTGQIHQLDFDDEKNKITKTVYKPKVGEIWHLTACPTGNDLLGLCYNHITDRSAQLRSSVWRLPVVTSSELQHVCELIPGEESLKLQECHTLDWHPNRDGTLATVLDTAILIWTLDNGSAQIQQSQQIDGTLYSGKWNPHLDGNQFSVIDGTNLTTLDTRTMKEAWRIPTAHKFQVRDMDFNPNKQYALATCGDDCCARFWDYRNSTEPLKVIKTHTHWVWRVRFNSFHDQLVLTSGSDSRVILHSIPSISSEPKGHVVFSDSEEEPEQQSNPLEEGILAKHEVHEDAVYAVEWSNCDAWTYASLSYDGRVVINRVPKSHKYKIIL